MERVASDLQIATKDALVGAGILAPTSVKGVYGEGPSFVATFDGRRPLRHRLPGPMTGPRSSAFPPCIRAKT